MNISEYDKTGAREPKIPLTENDSRETKISKFFIFLVF